MAKRYKPTMPNLFELAEEPTASLIDLAKKSKTEIRKLQSDGRQKSPLSVLHPLDLPVGYLRVLRAHRLETIGDVLILAAMHDEPIEDTVRAMCIAYFLPLDAPKQIQDAIEGWMRKEPTS